MSESINIPMFPLSIFPLPGELVPLHIFEPRYRQLLQDAETRDIGFGIYFNHTNNGSKFGSWVKLETVLKRYAGGESDIIVKCLDLFTMGKLFRTYQDKLYPGGEVNRLNVDLKTLAPFSLLEKYSEYAMQMNLKNIASSTSSWHIANDLNMDFSDKLKFVALDDTKKNTFLMSQLSYQLELLAKAEKSKDVFHLN